MTMDASTKQATIMLVSGDLEKAFLAFVIATGFAAMGVKVHMWFVLSGINCIKRRRGLLEFLHHVTRRWSKLKHPATGADDGFQRYRVNATDTPIQDVIGLLNRGGPVHLPLAFNNFGGIGPLLFDALLRKKKIVRIEELIQDAIDLDVKFTLCSICVDSLGLAPEDVVVPADVATVSHYMQEAMAAHYNVVM